MPGARSLRSNKGSHMRILVTGSAGHLGWQPRYDFAYVIERLRANEDFRSSLALAIGSKGYHAEVFAEGPYPIE